MKKSGTDNFVLLYNIIAKTGSSVTEKWYDVMIDLSESIRVAVDCIFGVIVLGIGEKLLLKLRAQFVGEFNKLYTQLYIGKE